MWRATLLDHDLLHLRLGWCCLLDLRLIDEVDGIDEVHVVLIDEGPELGKLHEVGHLEQFAQLSYPLLVGLFAQLLDNLVGGHLHGVEAEACLHVLAQGIGELGVVLLHVVLLPALLALDAIHLLQGHLVGRQLGSYSDTAQDGLVVMIAAQQVRDEQAERNDEHHATAQRQSLDEGHGTLHHILDGKDGIDLCSVHIEAHHVQRQGVRGIRHTIDQHLEGWYIVEGRIERGNRIGLRHHHVTTLVEVLRVGRHLAQDLDTLHHRVARVAGHDEVALRGAAHLDLHMGLLADEQHQRVDAGVHRHLREGRQGKKCT